MKVVASTTIDKTKVDAVRTKTIPESERAQVEYGGPHPWQISAPARLIRRMYRESAYTRHFNEAITELTVVGEDRLEALQGQGAIFCPNHTSHLDSLVFMEALPESIRTHMYQGAAADRWFRKGQKKRVLQPWYQSLILGTFPIVRGGGSRTLDYARWLLQQNQNVCIYPEGTRSTSDTLGKFRHGVSILATDLNVPIVPVYMSGLRKLRPKGALEITPGPAAVEFLEPLFFEAGTDVADATEQLWTAMNTRHQQEYAAELELARAA